MWVLGILVVIILNANIILPFALGVVPGGINFTSAALFTGISLSITAFRVLASTIQERSMHKTILSTIVTTCTVADNIADVVYTGEQIQQKIINLPSIQI